MPFGTGRVIEILFRIVPHAEPLHQAPGAPIGRHRVRDDLVETEPSETVFNHRLRCFKGIALAPIGTGEPPAHLDSRGERRLVRNPIQADCTDEVRFTGDLDRPLAKAMLVAMRLHPSDPRIARGTIRERQQHLHDRWIGGHEGKWLTVSVAPFAQQQTRCTQGNGHIRNSQQRRDELSVSEPNGRVPVRTYLGAVVFLTRSRACWSRTAKVASLANNAC
jgi:hypothetical protein